MIKQLLIIAAYAVMLIFVGGGIGLLVVIIIDNIFERIVSTPKTIETIRTIKTLIEETEDAERKYALKRLLSESRMCEWWKWIVVIFVTCLIALFIHKF